MGWQVDSSLNWVWVPENKQSEWDKLDHTIGKYLNFNRSYTNCVSKFWMDYKSAKPMNHEQIKQKIESIPGICKEGKEAVSNLLKEFGYVPPVVERLPKEGEIWQYKYGKSLAIIGPKGETYRCFHWEIGSANWQRINILDPKSWDYFADSINFAIQKLRK